MKKIISYAMIPLPLVAGVLRMLFYALTEVFLNAVDSFDPRDERQYKAEFGDIEDFLSPHNDGFCLTGTHCLTRNESSENVLLTGGIGAGKGIMIIINTIVRCSGNRVLVVNDPSLENYMLTSGDASTKCRVISYNFSDVLHSDSFNPLEGMQSKSSLFRSASILTYATQGTETKEMFWVLQCVNVIYAFSAIVKTLDPIYANYANVRHLISQFMSHPEKVDPLFVRCQDQELRELYYSLCAMSDNTRQSVLATALSTLSLWNDDHVTRLTAKSSFSFKDIRKNPVVIYLHNPTVTAKLYAPLIEIFYEQLIAELFSTLPSKGDLDCMFVMDEASTCPLKNSMNAYLNNGRKYRLNWLLAFQSHQVGSIYGSEASSIKSALRTKVWLGGAGTETSDELENLLGKTEVSRKDRKMEVRPLMTAQDIRQMKDECVIISPQGQAYRTATTPYFKQPFIHARTKIPPYQVVNPLVPDIVPLIPLYAPPKAK